MTKIPSVEKEIEYLRFAMRGGCNCKGCEDDRANIGEHCVIRQALQAQRDAGAEEEREKWIKAVGEKIDKTTRELMLSAFQEGVAVTRSQYNEAIKSITPPTK